MPIVQNDLSYKNELRIKRTTPNNIDTGRDMHISSSRTNIREKDSIVKSHSFQRNLKINLLVRSKDNSPNQT